MTITNLTVTDKGEIVEVSFKTGTTHTDIQIKRSVLMQHSKNNTIVFVSDFKPGVYYNSADGFFTYHLYDIVLHYLKQTSNMKYYYQVAINGDSALYYQIVYKDAQGVVILKADYYGTEDEVNKITHFMNSYLKSALI